MQTLPGKGSVSSATEDPALSAIPVHFSARQGVKDEHINLVCMGGRTMGVALAWSGGSASAQATTGVVRLPAGPGGAVSQGTTWQG